jgi:O-antigen chain-terminating methyltransferase
MQDIEKFYTSFEDKYRGSREVVLDRLNIYQPILQAIRDNSKASATGIDLGSGRGEWLELLDKYGIQGRGVDLNTDMVARCREYGLNASVDDAISALKACSDESVSIISAFHLVEHIPFDALYELVNEAKRVLERGGVLLLETPNPESVLVGSYSFYLDPTHRNPLPPLLLKHLCEYVEFDSVDVARLNQKWNGEEQHFSSAGFSELIIGYPDFSLIASKCSGENDEYASLQSAISVVCDGDRGRIGELVGRIDSALNSTAIQNQFFANELHRLSDRVEHQAEDLLRSQANTQELNQLYDRIEQQTEELSRAQEKLIEHTGELDRVFSALQHWQHLAEVKSQELSKLQNLYQQLLNSRTWRITMPLRMVIRNPSIFTAENNRFGND